MLMILILNHNQRHNPRKPLQRKKKKRR